MVEWHNEGLTSDDIQKIIREGRDKNDNTTFNDYGDYINYISKDNDRILGEYLDHDHSKCEPNEETIEAIKEAMDDTFISSVDGSEVKLEDIMKEVFRDNKEILDAIGYDYDEDGVAYWEKWEDDKKD
jgi:hypothetical protein